MKLYLFTKHLNRILFGALVLAMVFSLVSPFSMVALAQTDTPDDPQPGETSSGGGETEPQDQGQPAQPPDTGDDPTPPAGGEDETPSGGEVQTPPAEGEGQPSGEENGQAQEDLTGTVEALNELGAVVVDEEGEPQAMGSQKAQEVLSSSDPYFKRGDVTYYYQPVGGCGVTPNCTEAANPVQAALADLQANGLPDDGLLNVEAGTYDGFDITGFVNPGGGSLTVYSVDGVGAATFTDMVHIYNNIGLDVTLSGINVYTNSINPAILVEDNLDSDITLQDVDVQNDGGDGIVVDGQEGNVTLNSVDASGNVGTGIDVEFVDGTVTLENVTANDNTDWGIYLDRINGEVSLKDVIASGNGEWGVDIGYIYANVNLENVEASNNSEDGIYIGEIEGDVDLSGVTANGNDWVGIFLEEVLGDVHLSDIVANENGDAGLGVTYIYGSVDMSNVTAELNDSVGVGVSGVLENLTLKNITANNNGMTGIYVEEVYGDTTLADVVANMNTEAGVSLAWIGGSLYMKDVTANENQNGVLVSVILGDGASLTSVTAENNDENGVTVVAVVGYVCLKDVLASLNGSDGIHVDTVIGSVHLADVLASENGGYGIYVEDVEGNVYLWDVTTDNNAIDGFYVDTLGKVKVCFSQFNDNTGYGLNVSAGNGLRMLGEAAGNTAGDVNLRDATTLTTLKPSNCYPVVEVKKPSPPVYLEGDDIIVDFGGLTCGKTAPKAMVMPGKFFDGSTLPPANEGLPDSGVLGVVRTMVPPCAPPGYTYTISLKLPVGGTADNIKALTWVEGQGWVELPATVVDGRLVVQVTASGMFAFVRVESE
jgi:hypothetical protein